MISPAAKLPARALGRGRGRIGLLDPRDQRRIDRHIAVARQIEKALGKVGVLGLERGLDLARGDVGIERAVERMVDQQHRIVLRAQQRSGIDPARHDRQRRNRAGKGRAERQCNPRAVHTDSTLRTRPDHNW